MSLSAKILAFFNVVLAGAFMYFATQDWIVRQPWAYEAFRRELMLDGLPLDQVDPVRRVDQAVAPDLADESLGEYFKGAGVADGLKLPGVSAEGIPHYVHTQKEAVELIREELLKEIDGLPNDDAKKERISVLLLLQARTLEERNDLLKQLAPADFTANKARELLEARFQTALEDKAGDYELGSTTRRRRIAHLLFSISDPQKQRRVLVVVGIQSYEAAVAEQATNLHKMTERVQHSTLDERTAFESEYIAIVTQVLKQAYDVAEAQRDIASQKMTIMRQEKEVAKRKQEADDLRKDLGAAKEKTETALVKQEKLEKGLFAAQRELGLLREAAEKMEQEIRGLELRR